ncbi:MAG: hypothetical protein LQ338_007681 [Usnochroma carphineum]|nr:MAG: hypothetical protein LQ338_007681 [Usnochroma carphineum]
MTTSIAVTETSQTLRRRNLEVEIGEDSLQSQVAQALSKATRYAFDTLRCESHWCGELLSNVTITAEHVMFCQAVGIDLSLDSEVYKKYILAQQRQDGSWSLAPDHCGDVSTSSEAYLALKILGVSAATPAMQRARDFILRAGGIAKVRVLTRINFAQFGLFPWDGVPQLPAELIFMPSNLPINIYAFSSWARSVIVPLLIIQHHQPIYALPNGIIASNNFVDELWLDVEEKVPLGPTLYEAWKNDAFGCVFVGLDKVLCSLGGLRWFPLRSLARRQCVNWILERQEMAGDWAGIIPPMHTGIQALLLEGFKLGDPKIRHGLSAIERFAWQDENGKRIQACVSPVWDTVLMIRALCDAGTDRTDLRLQCAAEWCKARQQLGPEGDWRIYNSKSLAGGFSFEYYNTWYPDVDDTAAAILAFVSQNPRSVNSPTVERAAEWVLTMQNNDGGWAAFDINNNKLFLNKIPFCDMNNLCDPSSADVTGRVLEALGLISNTSCHEYVDPSLLDRIDSASDRAIHYLVQTQEPCGAWYGRWGVNYIYGTSHVLCGLAYFSENQPFVRDMIDCGAAWLKRRQNDEGGWGEGLDSYSDPSRAGRGSSTPSQTAWALMGLLTMLDPGDDAVKKGVAYLVQVQTEFQGEGASWQETQYTATGFPEHFYLGYSFYRHYFPMMALGRYLKAIRASNEKQHIR